MKKIDVENCKIIFDDTLGSIEGGEIKKDSALKDGTKSLCPLQEGLIRPTSGVTVGAGKQFTRM